MRIEITGGQPLNGVVRPAGNPNAAVTLMAATLLTDAPVTLHNVPDTQATRALADLARALGASIEWADDGVMTLTSAQIARRTLSHEETDRSVGALLLLAPLLARRLHARMEFDFPISRIRTHLEALRDLGCEVTTTASAIDCKASKWERRDVLLNEASVTATALVMMLAASLGGETVLHNAACEPHIQTLGEMLIQMGARISGLGSNALTIYGAATLTGAEAHVGAHYIEAASIAALTALCGGRVEIVGVRRAEMRPIARVLTRFGIQIDMDDERLFVPHHDGLRLSDRLEDGDHSVETAPWPGFPSDLAAIATVIATQTTGTTLIHEKMFANRLLFVDKLKAMGAQIVLCDPHRAIVVGASRLNGNYMDTPDMRAGLGMIAAALTARGTTQIDNAQVIGHTFGSVIDRLRALGAHIDTP